MRLKFVKSPQALTEADVNRGYRIKESEQIGAKVKKAVEAAGYKYKSAQDKGLYILPKDKYLSKIVLAYQADETLTATITNWVGETTKEIKDVSVNDFLATFEDIGTSMIDPIISLTNTLNESLILEYAPFKQLFKRAAETIRSITGAIDKHAANTTDKKAKRAILEEIVHALEETLNSSINQTAKAHNYIKVNSSIKDDSAEIELFSDFIFAVEYGVDVNDAKRIKAVKVITPLSETRIAQTDELSNVTKVLQKICKKLNITFDTEAPAKEEEKPARSESDSDNPDLFDDEDSYESELKRNMGDAARYLDESYRNISEALKLNLNANKYDTTASNLEGTVDGAAFLDLIRYFLLKETTLGEDRIRKITPKTLGIIKDIIVNNGKTFDINTNAPLHAILYYLRHYSKSYEKLIDIFSALLEKGLRITASEVMKTEGKTIDDVLDGKLSILYAPELFRVSLTDADELLEILRIWYDSRNSGERLLAYITDNDDLKTKLKDLYQINLDGVITKAAAKKAIMTDASGKKLRTAEELSSILDIIRKSGRAAKSEDDEIIDTETDEEVEKLEADDLDMTKLLGVLNADSKEAQKVRKLLKKLLSGAEE